MGSVGASRVLMVGAGGHARVCLDALRDSGHDVVGCVSRDGAASVGLACAVVGTDDDLTGAAATCGATHAFVAIGDNQARRAASARCADAGLDLVNAVSRFAMIADSAVLGSGVAVLPGAVVNAAARLADGAIVNTRASVDHDNRIDAYAHVSVGVALAGSVHVGEGALVGIGAVVLPGLSIGAGAVVGGGAVVVDDVAAGATVVGVPARELQR